MSGAVDVLASLVLESGRRWGEVATSWQWEDARAVLDEDGPRLHFLTRARGGSKDTDLAGMTVAALLTQLAPSSRSYVVATDRDQGRLLVDSLAGLVGRSGLAGAVRVEAWRAVAVSSGASLEVIPSDAPSAYGLRPVLVVANELSQWPSASQGVWTAIVSALPKVEGSRLVVLSSAGDPAHWSHRVRLAALASPRWRVHEVPGPVPWISAEALAEQRALLTDSQYARLHLNVWTASEDRLVSAENLAAAVVLDGPQEPRPGVRYAIGADLGLRFDRTAIAVCHSEPIPDSPRASRVVLDRMVTFAGTRDDEVRLGEVETALVALWEAYHRPKVRLDPWQGIMLAQRLKGRGVSVEEYSYSAQRYGLAASVLFGLLRDGRLALYDDPALLDELANVRLRETLPGLVRVDTDPGRHDDMVVALGFAATMLVERSGVPASLSFPSGTVRSTPTSTPGVPTGPARRVRAGRVFIPGVGTFPRVAGRR